MRCFRAPSNLTPQRSGRRAPDAQHILIRHFCEIAGRGSALTEVQRQESDEEHIDYNNHQSDVNIKSFDEDNNTHLNEKGKEFDYSKSYSLPPAEAPSKVVRRNKYGDIIEDV